MPHRSLVAITIVTFNSSRYIRSCLHHALAQDYPNKQLIVVDNNSSDGTPEILQEFEDRLTIVYNRSNTGFAAAQNQAMRLSSAPWVLTLNPDVHLNPDFLSQLVLSAEFDSSNGSACGKLLRMGSDLEPLYPPVFDSTGIYMTPNMRHLDRAGAERDMGQYNQTEYVFGATGAACLYRRSLIDSVSFEGEFFDEDFFAYREDADVAWRAQLMGWKCLYEPSAVAYHVRSVLPTKRSQVSPLINMHSVKNRWLLRIKNMTPSLYRRFWFAMTQRDLLVLAGCLVKEWSSLRAFPLIVACAKRAFRKRRYTMHHRRVSDNDLNSWFSDAPVSKLFDREKIAQS